MKPGTTGYAHPGYAASLSEFGEPRHLPSCDGWILERAIADSEHRDAMGPYPLFFCHDWSRLSGDLSDLASRLVSVVLVTDPFAEVDPATLDETFDRVVRFKEHYVVELDRTPEEFVSASHRASARRALREVDVRPVDAPLERLEIWQNLFANLSRRHSITGIRGFSHRAFELQLALPGMVMFEATAGRDVVGLDLWYQQGEVAYGHLAAFSDRGYELSASYATKWTMLHHFTGRVRWVDLAGTAGLTGRADDGLAMFKSGWSTGTRPVYLCGSVLQPEVYDALSRNTSSAETTYFPDVPLRRARVSVRALRFAFVVSTSGSVMNEVLRCDFVRDRVHLVVADHEGQACERARRHGVPTVVVAEEHEDRFSERLSQLVESHDIDFVFSYYTKFFSAPFRSELEDRIINFHPSLLPAFKGPDGFGDAVRYPARVTGNTVELVAEVMDAGKIIMQTVCSIDQNAPIEQTRHRVFVQQCQALIQVAHWLQGGRLVVEGRRVTIAGAAFDNPSFSPALDCDDAISWVPPDPFRSRG